jgi:hypothetical protein
MGVSDAAVYMRETDRSRPSDANLSALWADAPRPAVEAAHIKRDGLGCPLLDWKAAILLSSTEWLRGARTSDWVSGSVRGFRCQREHSDHVIFSADLSPLL